VISRGVALLLFCATAHAAPIVALAPDSDARKTIALGGHGEAYEPDGKGVWIRAHAGGLADVIARATRANGEVIASVDGGPPYAYRNGVWNLVVLGLHAKAVLGRGPRASAAVGKQVFGLETGKPVRLPDAPGVVAMLAAGKSIVVQTDLGLATLEGKKWKPIANAPKQVLALLDDRWAVVDRGLLDLRSQKVTAWPAGFRAASVVADNELVVAAGTLGGAAHLVTLAAGKLDHSAIEIAGTPIAVVADRAGRVVVATKDALAIRDKAGIWTAGELRDALPADRPGSPPAVQQ
jgi:hypothetical protein